MLLPPMILTNSQISLIRNERDMLSEEVINDKLLKLQARPVVGAGRSVAGVYITSSDQNVIRIRGCRVQESTGPGNLGCKQTSRVQKLTKHREGENRFRQRYKPISGSLLSSTTSMSLRASPLYSLCYQLY